MRIVFVVVFSLLLVGGYSQKEPTLIWEYEKRVSQIELDNTGKIYLLSGDEIVQLGSSGQVLNRFSNKVAGHIYFMDFFYDLKPLVFYRSNNQFVYLDNRLAPRSELLSLNQLGYPQASLVASSNMNYLWIYDAVSLGIVRINANLEKSVETGNLNQILGMEIEPVSMFERYNKLYLNDPKIGILVFDIYGNYKKTIPLTNLYKFKVDNNLIYFADNKGLHLYDQVANTFNTIALPITRIADILVQKNNIWISDGTKVYYYRLE